MATTYDKASLVMIPSGYKDDKLYSVKPTDGSGDFTFSRDGAGASPATRVNASGLIEKGRTNEILYSNAFDNAYWNKTAVTISTGQADPNGGNNAFKIVEDTSTNFHRINGAYTMVSGNVYATSVTAKAAGRNFLSMSNNVSAGTTMFDLTDGSVHLQESGVVAAKTTDLGGGWYRCEMVAVGDKSGSYNVFLGCDDDGTIGTYLGDGASGVLIFQSQIEDGLVATDYIETTTAPVSAGLLGDMPRLDYHNPDSPTPNSCPSLLLEPSRVNLVSQSEYFGDSSWTKTAATTEIGFLSPEGNLNAYKLLEDNTNSIHRIYQTSTISASPNATISVYVKYNGRRFVLMRIADSVVGRWYDIENGVLGSAYQGTPNDSTIEPVGNDWYRITISHSVASVARFELWVSDTESVSAYTGDITKGVYLYGAQLEAGSYPTSYIPTYGSASTRGGDVCIDAGNSSTFNDAEGTLFINVEHIEGFVSVSDGTGNNRISIGSELNDPRILFLTQSGGAIQTYIPSNNWSIGSSDKVLISYKLNEVKMYINGALVSTDTSYALATGLDVCLFTSGGVTGHLNGDLKQVLYFPTALTESEAIALTTI